MHQLRDRVMRLSSLMDQRDDLLVLEVIPQSIGSRNQVTVLLRVQLVVEDVRSRDDSGRVNDEIAQRPRHGQPRDIRVAKPHSWGTDRTVFIAHRKYSSSCCNNSGMLHRQMRLVVDGKGKRVDNQRVVMLEVIGWLLVGLAMKNAPPLADNDSRVANVCNCYTTASNHRERDGCAAVVGQTSLLAIHLELNAGQNLVDRLFDVGREHGVRTKPCLNFTFKYVRDLVAVNSVAIQARTYERLRCMVLEP